MNIIELMENENIKHQYNAWKHLYLIAMQFKDIELSEKTGVDI